MQLTLPLVSVVISNYNYGRFLKEAVDSVYRQTYELVECIVVDDSSTDTSASVLDVIQGSYPNAAIIRHRENGGQGLACQTGFAASRGQYVVFMDADDVLHPDFVSTHVYVHLSSRTHPGISSSDIFQCVDGRVVVCTGQAMNDYVIAHSANAAALFRPVLREPSGPWTLDQPGPGLLEGVTYVPPGHVQWCWSPGTANMFRRDALSLVIPSDELVSMRIGSDAFLCLAVGSLCGGVLIDRALSVYRIHGGNAGTHQAQLRSVRAVRSPAEPWRSAIAALISHHTRRAAEIVPRLWGVEPYVALLESLDASIGELGENAILSQCIVRHREALSEALGQKRFSRWIARRRIKAFKGRWRRPRGV